MWQIAPRSEKEIIQLSFRGAQPGRFQGYVHVKTDRENMVLPVELHVLRGGLHATPPEVDFGILTSFDERRDRRRAAPTRAARRRAAGAAPSAPVAQLSVRLTRGAALAAGAEHAGLLASSRTRARRPGRWWLGRRATRPLEPARDARGAVHRARAPWRRRLRRGPSRSSCRSPAAPRPPRPARRRRSPAARRATRARRPTARDGGADAEGDGRRGGAPGPASCCAACPYAVSPSRRAAPRRSAADGVASGRCDAMLSVARFATDAVPPHARWADPAVTLRFAADRRAVAQPLRLRASCCS